MTRRISKGLGVFAASAVLSVTAIEANPAQAAIFTNPTTGNQYFVTERVSTWEGSQAQAVAAGGNLVTINDAAEQQWLWDTFGRTTSYWIGLTDKVTEGVWQWVSGQDVTYLNWNSGEPNNSGNEDYVAMDNRWSNYWNDLPNAGPSFRNTYGIVEIEVPQSVPEPEMVTALAIFSLGALATKKLSSKGSDN